jgi:hypothetical protein
MLLVCVVSCGQTPVERRGEAGPAEVASTVDAAPDAVRGAIVTAFSGDRHALPEKWRRFKVAKPGDDYFPRADQIASSPGDLFLYDFSDADDEKAYWPSEYYAGERPVPFRCNFLIRIRTPDSASRAGVEVVETSPRVWVGKKFGWEAHGPGTYLDIRDVSPTLADRVELLKLLRQLAGG